MLQLHICILRLHIVVVCVVRGRHDVLATNRLCYITDLILLHHNQIYYKKTQSATEPRTSRLFQRFNVAVACFSYTFNVSKSVSWSGGPQCGAMLFNMTRHSRIKTETRRSGALNPRLSSLILLS